MRAGWAAVGITIVGCDAVFGIAPVYDASPVETIPIDAAPFSCRRDWPNVELCADFDSGSASYYATGTETSLSLVATGSADVMLRSPSDAPSPPHVLDVVSHGGMYAPELATQTFHRVVVDLDARVDSTSNQFANFAGIVRVAANAPQFSSCYIDLALDIEVAPELVMIQQCGGFGSVRVSNGLPVGWFHAKIVLDLSIPRAQFNLDQGMEKDLAIGSGADIGTHDGYVSLGMIAGFDGVHVQLDNLLVRLDP